MFLGRVLYLIWLYQLLQNHTLNKVTEKKKLFLWFVRYVGAYMTSRDWLENLHSIFPSSFSLSKESENFLCNFCNLLVQSFVKLQSRIGWLFCEKIRNYQRPKVVLTPSIYKSPREETKIRKFWPVINSVFTQEWRCVKWMANTALKTKRLKF